MTKKEKRTENPQPAKSKKKIVLTWLKRVGIVVLSALLAFGLYFGAHFVYARETQVGFVTGRDYLNCHLSSGGKLSSEDSAALTAFLNEYYYEGETYAGFLAMENDRAAENVVVSDGQSGKSYSFSVENTFYGYMMALAAGDSRQSLLDLDIDKIRNTLPLFLQAATDDLESKNYTYAIKKLYYTSCIDDHLSTIYRKTPLWEEGQAEVYEKLKNELYKKLNSLNDEAWLTYAPLLFDANRGVISGVPRYRYRAYYRRLKKIYKAIQKQEDSILKVRFYLVNNGFYKKNCGDFITETADIYEALAAQPAGICTIPGEGISADLESTFLYLRTYNIINGTGKEGERGRLRKLMVEDRGLDPNGHCRAFAENLYQESGILFPAAPGEDPTFRSVYEGLYLYL